MAHPELVYVDPPHPATLDDEALLRQCTLGFGRHAGPGGQHRNKVETGAQLVHEATGIRVTATERRQQSENRRVAIRRMRVKLAIKVRTPVSPKGHQPSELWVSRRQGTQMSVNPRHRDYPALLAEALDVITARKYDVAGAAGVLGVSMSQLAKLVRHERHAFAIVNDGREKRGLKPLK